MRCISKQSLYFVCIALLAALGLAVVALAIPAWVQAATPGLAVSPEVLARIERSPTCCQISGIAAVVTARDPSTGLTIQFNRPQSLLSIGQNVWLSQRPAPGGKVAKLAVGVQFPFEKTRQQKVGDQDHMKTTIKVSFTPGLTVGRVDGTTKTWTTSWYDGFTGGVMYFLQDKVGNNLPFFPPIRKYGVNGTAVPGAASDRTDHWSDSVPLEIVNKISKVAIVHVKKPTPRVDDFLAYAKEAGEAAQVWVEVITAIAGAGGGGGTGPGEGGTGGGGPTQPSAR